MIGAVELDALGSKNLMILASAGSGKTHQLVNRVIRLVVDGADPAQIVALTFTRKAAGEFADAILVRLARAASDPGEARRLGAAIGREGVDFVEILGRVVRALPRFTLGTMDGFFTLGGRAFQHELGISGGGFELIEGSRAELFGDLVLTRVLGAEEVGGEEFARAFRRATMGREDVGVLEPLRGYVAKWHDIWLDRKGVTWGPEGLAGGGEVGEWEARKRELAKAARAGTAAVAFTDKRQSAALEAFIDSLESHTVGSGGLGDLRTFGEKVFEACGTAGGGPLELSHYKPFSIDARTADILREMVGLVVKCEVAAAILRTRALRDVVARVDEVKDALLRRRGMLGFDDVKRLMGRWAYGEDERLRREMVDFRLDAKFRHWLLDEFQDTSRGDWQGLVTLVQEAVSDEEGSLFVVGDKKQAIYGWRGGDVRLFDEIREHYGIDTVPMAESWRSCPEVLELVNRVCGDTATMKELFGESAERWEWQDHVPAEPLQRPDRAGEAVVEVVGDLDERLVRCAAILREIGVGERRLTCAVLLRSNEKARVFADYLRAESFDVVLEGARKPASESPVGWFASQWLRWLADPNDRFARSVVEMSEIGAQALAQAEGSWEVLWERGTTAIAAAGFGATLARLLEGHADLWSEFGRRRANDLVAALSDMDRQGLVSIREAADRLDRWEVSQAPGEAEVQVMTIHKSKGLGFDVVILPEISDDEVPKTQRFTMAEGDGWLLEPPPVHVRRLVPEIREAEDRWREAQRYEAFCGLYVALTRAKRGLYVLLDEEPKSGDSSKASLARWMRVSLQAEGGGGVVFRAGNRGWWESLPPLGPEKSEPETVLLGAAVTRRERFSPSALKSAPGSGVRHGSAGGLAFGAEVHRLLEQVTWLDEVTPSLPESDAGREVQKLLETASIRALLTREGRSTRCLVEQPLDALMDGRWLSGVVDRMHLQTDEKGTVSGVEIIDWKTDAVEDAVELLALHRGQMEAYRTALQLIYPAAPVRCLLVSVRHRQIVEVPTAQ